MADYYPLIARAIAGLDPSAPGESRRALYERARTALIAQLRSVQPPLSESEITRERLSLEEAVRKVESEAAQRAREASRPAAALPRAAATLSAAPMPGRRNRSARAAAPPPGRRARVRRRQRPSRDARPPLGQDDSVRRAICAPMHRRRRRRGRSRRRSRCRTRSCRRPANGRAAPRPRQCAPPKPPPPPGMRGFRDIAADADDLGRAAAQANRAARKTYANVPSPSPEFDRLEPSMENRGADPDAPYSYDESVEEAERYAPQPPCRRRARRARADATASRRSAPAPARCFRSRARSRSASC